MKVLIVEDDKDVGAYIASGLKENGHVADIADNGKVRVVHGDDRGL